MYNTSLKLKLAILGDGGSYIKSGTTYLFESKEVKTNFTALIRKTRTYGFYHITRLQHSAQFPDLFYDIWILATEFGLGQANEGVITFAGEEKLKSLAAATKLDQKSVKCCYWDKDDRNNYINGFARVISYTVKANKVTDVFEIYEGAIYDGRKKGFGRQINGFTNQMFIGGFDEVYDVTEMGVGVYYKDGKSNEYGVFEHDHRIDEPPGIVTRFDEFPLVDMINDEYLV